MNTRTVLTITGLAFFACSPSAEAPADATTDPTLAAAAAEPGAALAELLVYKTPSCGCCTGWVEHMREHDYPVTTRDLPNLVAIKRDVGVPANLASCHTGIIEGYVIEGHVPAEAVAKLLAERPEIAGLSVPGMPIGSPGMEGPNPQPYTVYAFDRDGSATEYMQIDPR